MYDRKRYPAAKVIPALALFALLLGSLSGCGKGSAGGAETASDTLSIPLEELSDEPSFVDWEQDGQAMQLIALRDGDGARVAYNTCQSCAGSPYAYFEYEDGVLQCQNCGFTFELDSIGAVTGGCNPKPVSNVAIEDGAVKIGASELKSAAPDFETWKDF